MVGINYFSDLPGPTYTVPIGNGPVLLPSENDPNREDDPLSGLSGVAWLPGAFSRGWPVCPLARLASTFSGVQRSVCLGKGWTAACLPCLDCEKPSTSTVQRNVRLNGSYINLRIASFRLFPRTSYLLELVSTSSPQMATSRNDILCHGRPSSWSWHPRLTSDGYKYKWYSLVRYQLTKIPNVYNYSNIIICICSMK